MRNETSLLFGDFQLDPRNECLWQGDHIVKLTPKAFAVLCCLPEQAGQLVTKDELWNAVWPGTVVTDATLTMCMSEVRKALGDNAKTPRFIETVHRRGYRFIGQVVSEQLSVVSERQGRRADSQLATGNRQLTTPLVGRETELTQLHGWLEKALSSERQIVFVSGEPGIGKTALIETFLRSLLSQQVQGPRSKACPERSRRVQSREDQTLDPRRQTLDAGVWVGWGQCIEYFGAGEAYLPVLAALGQLGRDTQNPHLVEVLHHYAPTWLVQMPALVKPDEFEALQRRTAGATRARMLREMAEALEVLTHEQPLVLVLEDLHWSDPSTLELLSFIARRKQNARLLIVGTYRPVEVLANGHPLRAVTQEIQLHQQCEALPLGLLTVEHVAEYLETRMSGKYGPETLQHLAYGIHRRTEGNPLFMVNFVDALLTQGSVGSQQIEGSTPTTIRQMIERQFDHLQPAEQHVLAVASVVGAEFSAAAVAAGIHVEVVEVETHCAELARREQFLWQSGQSVWPDGTKAERFRFRHALYQEVIYERMTTSQRAEWHRRIGERLEAGYGKGANEIAAELAMHFEWGHDIQRAIHYRQQAGQNALRRNAHQEAIGHLTQGLELLKTLSDTPERAQQELLLQTALGAAWTITKGIAAQETERAYTRARELCQQVGETPQLLLVLYGLSRFYAGRAEFQTARELAEQLLRIAQRLEPTHMIGAHYLLGVIFSYMGEFTSARAHLEQGIALYDRQQHYSLTFIHGAADPGVSCLCHLATALWALGYPDQALKKSEEYLSLARDLAHPYTLALALDITAGIHLNRREVRLAQERAEEQITLASREGFSFLLALGTSRRGQALAQ